MSKGILVLLVLGAAGLAGASAAAAPRVSLQIRPRAIVYEQEILLKGKIPNGRAHEQVRLLAHTCGFTGAAQIRTLVTRRGGAFSFRIGPALRTAYSVSWRKSRSRAITVGVAPLMTLDKVAGGYRIDVGAGGGSSFEGKRALLQRLAGKKWRTVGSARLKLTSPPDALKSLSSGTVNAQIKHGTKLRGVLPLAQARPCYRAAVSPLLSG